MHLLVATDFSEAAELALDRAISLASLDPGALLTVMHVQAAEGLEVIRQMFGAEVEKMDRALELDAADRLKAIAEKCERILGRKIITHLSHGRPEAEIIGTAVELSADLIVMGERGRTPVGSPFLGGTIERVLQRAECSILAVKQPVTGPYQRLLVGVNSGGGSPSAAELAFLLNPGSQMVLLHAFEAPFEDKFRRAGATDNWVSEYRLQSRRAAEQDLEQAGSRLDAAGIQAQRLVVQGPAAAMIVEYGNSLSADLIVVGKRKRSMLGDLLFGDVARQVTIESKADVLIASSLPNLRALALGESMN
jgi:nucleotide-binding universal stress UspA family protein